MAVLHPLKWRLLVEEMVRLRRADEQRRFAASLRRGRIDPNPHQIDAVVFALRRIPEGGCILADEVGLGKTIEAGLVIAQLLAEGKRRVLLIVPKSLLGQWQNELRDLFSIEAREGRPDPEAFAGAGVFLVHREFAGGPIGSSLLCTSDPFDLVVIDEAHEFFANIYKRFDKEGNYKDDSDEAQFADRVRSLLKPAQTPVLMLTATPIQNALTELWGLVQYVEPTDALLGKLSTFREVFCQDKDRSAVAGQEFELRRRLGSVLQRTLRRQAQEFLEVPFAERRPKLIEYSMSPPEKDLYNNVTAWLMDPYLCSFACKSRRLLVIAFHRRMASSLAALRSSLEKVADRLRKQLAGAGGQPWDDLAADFARDFEEDLEELLADDREGDSPLEPPTKERLHAELVRIEEFMRRARAISRESKADSLLTALKAIADQAARGDGTGKVVIFTESLQTQDFLQNLLTTNGFGPDEITLFRGQNEGHADKALRRWEEEVGKELSKATKPSRQVALRLALVHEFRTYSKVFISTEAGAKGLNLQFCENLINYDLPWNPQRIEQRIGRVHRYGQKKGVVTILSFLDRDNEAQRLTFDILSQKLDLFGKVLDFTDPVLEKASADFPEPLVSGVGADFAGQLRRIYGNAKSVEEVASGLRRLRDSMEEKRREFDAEQSRAAKLIETRLDDRVRQAFQRYREDLAGGLEQIDRDLDSLVGTFLEAVGAKFERRESPGRISYEIRPCAQLPEEYREGGNLLIGRATDSSNGEPLHHGHVLVLAAIDKAREVTAGPLAVEVGPGDGALPACLVPHVGRRGRLVVIKVSYRGIEAADHLLVSAVLENQDTPLKGLTVESLLALSVVDPPQPDGPPGIDRELLDEAVEEAVLEDQTATTAKDDATFNRKLEQLDRYLEDQILVRKRQLATLERRREEAERKMQSAASPVALAQRGLEATSVQGRIEKLEKDIGRLQEGKDPDYQEWRDRLFERRYRRPGVERILEVDFRVAGGGAATC